MLLRVNVKVNVFIFFYGLRILFANKAIWLQFPIPFLPLLWKVSKKSGKCTHDLQLLYLFISPSARHCLPARRFRVAEGVYAKSNSRRGR